MACRTHASPTATPRAQRQNDGDVTLRFTLTNTGRVAGTEVAQVYASLPAAAGDVPQRLVGFERVALAPGQTRQVSITLPGLALRDLERRLAGCRGGLTHAARRRLLARRHRAASTVLRLRSQRVDHAR